MKTYLFKAELAKEEDGRWSSWVDALPGCAAWGHSEEAALDALKDAVQAYIDDMIEAGEAFPSRGVEVIEAPVVAITI